MNYFFREKATESPVERNYTYNSMPAQMDTGLKLTIKLNQLLRNY